MILSYAMTFTLSLCAASTTVAMTPLPTGMQMRTSIPLVSMFSIWESCFLSSPSAEVA